MNPELLVLLLTTRCNLSCSYCYLNCGPKGEDLPWEVFEALLRRLKAPPKEVILSGGEPTLVPELLIKVTRALRERFGRLRISLQTNGTLLEPYLLTSLQGLRVGIGISLDGPPELNEAQRGKTSSVVKGLRLLSALNMPCGVTITVTRANAARLAEVLLFLVQFPAVASFGLDILRPVGRGQSRDLPSATDLRKGLSALVKAWRWLNQRGKRLLWREASRTKNSSGYCPAERGQALVLTPQGELYPCASLVGHREYLLGSIIEHTPSFQALPSACRDCPEKESCPGRCPSRALFSPEAAALDCVVRKVLSSERCYIV